ncbi:aminotransferase class I/II-fold pyridoxal phosphate-dependent enzyme [Curvibacter sp. APW13]|uniref:DegT/DnrJ/EryC1/StrS family aminotransferase n=1 Tax=Curvibacter sp. APW13 TaxID=3077236 RepID=UPI0028DFA1EB|nr:aminotransferase class I/II-fold pyridoxal phosphate-dependent enzyme [Curvibacter sp. APW13]MDT8993019.1 aminotransferase class I/II-fold pyridoxal phosphate-dependent enzyme [Curvibacter sp. APW13]
MSTMAADSSVVEAHGARVVLSKPSITDLELRYVAEAARDAWGESCYQWIHRFEADFARYIGVKYAVATSSGTGALHLGLLALGLTAGDEVILADTNWIATVAPITYVGAVPVFVDIDPDTWCLDVEQVRNALSPRTRAVIATHLYGNACDMDALRMLCQKAKVALIEDAAEALGTTWNGQMVGSMGAFGIFSFHGSKTITTGEGGMWVSNDADLHATVRQINNHGRAIGDSRQFWPERIGLKYRMSDLQAAMGCAQLERIEFILQKKRAILARYRELLAGLETVRLNPEPPLVRHGAWMPNVVFDAALGLKHGQIFDAFRAANIDARPFFWPLSHLGLFGGAANFESHAWKIQQLSVNLPSFVDMREDEIERVVAVVRSLADRRGGQ